MKKSAITSGRKQFGVVLFSAMILLHAGGATAGIHTWDVREVFSNADGTIQYVELIDNGTSGTETGVGNGSLSSSLHSISWTNGAVATPTNGKSYLVATAGFAALPGAPVPDFTILPANVPFFDTSGDTVAFGGFDSFVFGAVPINGTDSLDAVSGAGPNTPKNYAGTQGSVDAGAPPALPSASMPATLLIVSLLLIGGTAKLRRVRSAAIA